MKRIITLILILLTAVILISCAAGRYRVPDVSLGNENWNGLIDRHSDRWAQQADQWFLAGDLTAAEVANDRAGYHDAISDTAVRVPNFHDILVNGDFQVQIDGTSDENSVFVEGPNDAVRAVAVNVRGKALCLEQIKEAPSNMGRVIAHVSVKHLRVLEHNGSGSVEGIKLFTNNLNVTNSGNGNIFLAGHINVKCIVSKGCGSINIFTTNACDTQIESMGPGEVNVAATHEVVLRSIKHQGTGDVNIIHGVSNGLVIDASGKGKIGISGHVNIKEIKASGEVCVLINASNSHMPCIYVYNDAHVGIAGSAGTLYAYTTRKGQFMGRYLIAQNAYLEASGTSHMNVNVSNRAFAKAQDYGSIYFFGNPEAVTPFEKNYGTIITMGPGGSMQRRG